MKRKLLLIVPVGLVLLSGMFLTGCATIFSGTTQSVSITTDPADAAVVIYDENNSRVLETVTPAKIKLKRGTGFFRGASYTLEITKDGYGKQFVQITPALNGGWYIAGNIVLGGLLGIVIIDPLTGAMWNLTPKNIKQTLRPSDVKTPIQKSAPDETVPALLPSNTSDDYSNRRRDKSID
ncbi:MAG: hypothetical protein LBH75_09355 [Treponema sp.]|jgi:hypothetical protein|nr:hypothetical protein [Treponema sp.]